MLNADLLLTTILLVVTFHLTAQYYTTLHHLQFTYVSYYNSQQLGQGRLSLNYISNGGGNIINILQTKYPMMWRDCVIIVFVVRVIMAAILYRLQYIHPVL